MRRRLPLVAVALLAACQEYQFSPVGRCLLQPGRASVTANVAAVDILFVVDDSGSMDSVQERLGNNFATFINRLAQKQQARVDAGKDPFDFHIAITSSSVLVNRALDGNGDCGSKTAGLCSIDNVTRPPDDRRPYTYACTAGPCGDIVTNYYAYMGDNCTPGVLRANGDPFPAGSFLAAGSNPKVLSFSRDLNWRSATTDPTIQDLIAKFRENIKVGSCGASQEMHFEAMRRAIQKALAGGQGAAWPHPDSQLAVIIIGNEDDCSTARADEGGLVWNGGGAGRDTCYTDSQRATPLQLYPVAEYTAFLKGLGRPIVAAFVRPGFSDCGAVVPGTRMKKLHDELQSGGSRALETSVCGDFAAALDDIASELSPPDHLQLPSVPAAGVVTQLRVLAADGASVHVCKPAEWSFVSCGDGSTLGDGQTSACIRLQRGGGCEPEPGQTLQAEYLGRVPESGCANDGQCGDALGGDAAAWRCVGASGAQRGTCVCAG